MHKRILVVALLTLTAAAASAKETPVALNWGGHSLAVGASAGGHLAQCLGVRDTRDPHPTECAGFSSQVQAVWNIFGPVDFTQTFSDVVKGLIKGLVGGDWFDAEQKGGTGSFQLQGTFNALITSNARLRVRLQGDVGAWGRRLNIVRYEAPPPAKTSSSSKGSAPRRP